MPCFAAWAVVSGRRKAMARKRKTRKTDNAILPVMRSNAAGIDIGATEIYVAVPADRDAENVRSFPTFTQDLYRLADWLRGRRRGEGKARKKSAVN